MSYHTAKYLNSGNIMVGNVKKTGRHAWWYNQTLEDPNVPTHFDGFIPLALVQERLFGWETLESVSLKATFHVPAKDRAGALILDDSGEPYVLIKTLECPSFKALGRGDWVLNGVPEDEESGADAVLHIQGKDYGTRQLKQLFISTVADLVGGADQIGVESAGLLKWGRRGWITVSIPENLHNDASGLTFRPQLTVSTSFDSTLPTSFTRTFGIPVCDNTLDYEIMKAGDTGRVVFKNTKNSDERISKVREVLGLLTEQAENADSAITEMSKIEVTDVIFSKWLDELIPVPEAKITDKIVSIQGQELKTQSVSTKGITQAVNKRQKFIDMYNSDERVTPWRGTKLGILQLVNTFAHHESRTSVSAAFDGNRLAARVEGNMMKVISNKAPNSFNMQDQKAIALLDKVLESESPVKVAVPVGAPSRSSRSRKAMSN